MPAGLKPTNRNPFSPERWEAQAMPDLKAHVARVATGEPLSREEARAAFEIIMSGDATQAQIGAFLMALRVRGETVDEITGAVSVLREKMTRVSASRECNRYRRHRWRRIRHLQYFDRLRACDRRRRGSCRQARQSRAIVEVRRGRRSCCSRRQYRDWSGSDLALHLAGRCWLHVRADAPCQFPTCRTGTRRARNPDGV